jgi:hypothetical protein
MRAPGEKVVNSQAARITVLRRSDVADDVTGIVGDVLMDKCSKHRTNAYFDPQGVSMARAPIKFQLLAKAGGRTFCWGNA